jgi:hypothetical protein
MRILLATLVMSGFAASSAYAQCAGHVTTAQSKAPAVVAQTTAEPALEEAIDETVTASIEKEDLRKKRLIVATLVQ